MATNMAFGILAFIFGAMSYGGAAIGLYGLLTQTHWWVKWAGLAIGVTGISGVAGLFAHI